MVILLQNMHLQTCLVKAMLPGLVLLEVIMDIIKLASLVFHLIFPLTNGIFTPRKMFPFMQTRSLLN